MRIRTQFLITMFLFALLLIGVSASVMISNNLVSRANSQQDIADIIDKEAQDLSYLSSNYLIYGESQQLDRWQTSFVLFSADVAKLRVSVPEQQALVDNIKANEERLEDVFNSIIASYPAFTAGQGSVLDQAFLQISWSRISVQTQGLVSDATRLSRLLNIQADRLKQTSLISIFIMMGLFIAYFISMYFLIQRRALKSISELRAGTEIIGSGNLNHTIKVALNNEVGELSHAFNLMTNNLRDVTASKADLEREISARKQAEEELTRVNRELRAISECNQIMVRAENEQSLLEDICRTICEAANYCMAWVGTIEHDEAKSIRPVAWSGMEDGYLNNAAITWADTERGRGPTGTAARTGKTHFFHDFAAEPAAAPWREDAEARGYRSSIALPLADSAGIVFAVFTLYASQPNGFTPAEVKLLEELAGDLAFGIGVIRTRTERDRMEDALKHTANEWQATFDAMTDMVSIQSNDFKLMRVNKAYEAVSGKHLEELIGRRCYEVIHGANGPPPGCPHLKTVLTGKPVTEEIYEPRLGIYLEVSTAPVLDAHGKVIGTVHIAKDITGRKKTEAEMAHLASFPELNPNPVIEINKTGQIIYANPTATTKFPDLGEKGNSHPFLAGMGSVFEELTGNIVYSLNREINMGESWWEQTITYVPGTKTFRLYSRNITERKHAEEALRETRDYLDNLFNYANAPIIVWDPDFRITRFNHAFERLTGWLAEEVLGNNLDMLFPAVEGERSMKHILDTLAGKRWEVLEIPILHKDGTVYTVLWNSATLYAADGKTPVATMAQGQDITQRKNMENALERRTGELEDANKELESFSYSVSHDLREPLRAIDGFTRILDEDYRSKLDDEGKRVLKTILKGTERMGQLIADLLSFSRISRQYMSASVVDMDRLVKSVSEELKTPASERNLDIRIGQLPQAHGDTAMMRQVLTNLLSNAVKFTRPRQQAVIEVGCTTSGTENVYYVKDNGVGFNSQYAGKLFNMFQRLHTQEQFEGTGVGLAIVHRIIHRHGGRVWAESTQGEGATFYFALPVTTEEYTFENPA